MNACEKGMHPEKAPELLREMQQKDMEPNVIMHSVAMKACEKGLPP